MVPAHACPCRPLCASPVPVPWRKRSSPLDGRRVVGRSGVLRRCLSTPIVLALVPGRSVPAPTQLRRESPARRTRRRVARVEACPPTRFVPRKSRPSDAPRRSSGRGPSTVHSGNRRHPYRPTSPPQQSTTTVPRRSSAAGCATTRRSPAAVQADVPSASTVLRLAYRELPPLRSTHTLVSSRQQRRVGTVVGWTSARR